MTEPDYTTVPPFHKSYVDLVKDFDMMEALTKTGSALRQLTESITEEKGLYRYAEGKWSIKEVLCHLLDSERIFCYRALRIARGDQTPLAGFDEQTYGPEANAHARTIVQLTDEQTRLRQTTLDLFRSFTPAMLNRIGTANSSKVSVINIGYLTAGHTQHHINILRERYL